MKITNLFVAVFLSYTMATFASCSDDDPVTEQQQVNDGDNSENNGNESNSGNEENSTSDKMEIKIGNMTFTATLADNETAKAFKAMLPMTVAMNELNGNEKYHNLSNDLPTDAYRPGTIQEGDLMLYGSNCIVLFYETFSTTYSYTRIGRLDDPTGLAEAVGSGNVNVTFELSNQE